MKKLFFILFSISLILSCNFKKENNKKQENKIKITYERGYGPKLIDYVWDGDRRSEKYDMNDSVLNYERIYINGVLDSSTEFYGNGNLWFQTQYNKGVRDGNHICYNEDDTTIKYIQIYENDSLVSNIDMLYFENGNLFSEITTYNGKSNGLAKLYYENGALRTKGYYKNGKAHGTWRVYYMSGNLKILGKWYDDTPNGTWKYYDERSRLVEKREFLKGEIINEQFYDEINDLDTFNLNIARELGHCYDELIPFDDDPESFYPICSTDVRVFFLKPNYYCVYTYHGGWCGSCGCHLDIYKMKDNEYEKLGICGCIVVDIQQPVKDYILISDTYKTSYCWTSYTGKYNIKNDWLNLLEIVHYDHKLQGLESDYDVHMDTCMYVDSLWKFRE